MYRCIKELVFDLIRRTSGKIDYKTVTEEVKKYFPKSKWKKTHWSWYRSQITSDHGKYRHSFSSKERRNLQTNQEKLSRESNPKGYDAEQRVRNIIEGRLQKKFCKRTLIVGHRSNREAIRHEFDLVVCNS